MLGKCRGQQRQACPSDYVVFDLETTGLSCERDAVIELSALRVRGGEVQAEYSSLVDPGRPIPCGAFMVNGIRDEMVAGKPDFKQVLREFLDFAGEDVLVGHNIRSFDMKFLYRDALAYWGAVPDNDFVDTLLLSRALLPELRHHSLGALAAHYRISTLGAHRALADCYMNQKVFEALKQEQLPAVAFCPRCGQPLKKRNGRFGPFFGCSGYPDCRFTRNCEP